jgi:DNA-binding response OmpR family regulator
MHALVVEDDPRIAWLVERLLAPWKLDVYVAGTGAEAMEILEFRGASLAFAYVDIGLPDMSGLQVVDEIRRRRPSLPIVVATGDADQVELPGVALLTKPFVVGRFQAIVDDFVRSNRLDVSTTPA